MRWAQSDPWFSTPKFSGLKAFWGLPEKCSGLDLGQDQYRLQIHMTGAFNSLYLFRVFFTRWDLDLSSLGNLVKSSINRSPDV